MQYDLEDLSDEALDELVSNIILHTQGDPDVELLGLADEDYAGEEDEDKGRSSGSNEAGEGVDHSEL